MGFDCSSRRDVDTLLIQSYRAGDGCIAGSTPQLTSLVRQEQYLNNIIIDKCYSRPGGSTIHAYSLMLTYGFHTSIHHPRLGQLSWSGSRRTVVHASSHARRFQSSVGQEFCMSRAILEDKPFSCQVFPPFVRDALASKATA